MEWARSTPVKVAQETLGNLISVVSVATITTKARFLWWWLQERLGIYLCQSTSIKFSYVKCLLRFIMLLAENLIFVWGWEENRKSVKNNANHNNHSSSKDHYTNKNQTLPTDTSSKNSMVNISKIVSLFDNLIGMGEDVKHVKVHHPPGGRSTFSLYWVISCTS